MIALDEFCAKIKEGLEKNHSIIFNCQCIINYSGRAESHLPLGDRTLMIKKDKTLLCHQPSGSNPVNYMKENTNHSVNKEGDYVVLQSRNLPEFMDIKINKVYFFHSQSLEDSEKIRIAGTEEDMACHIMENPEIIGKDFKPLSKEEHTKYGFIDVFGYDQDNNLVVVECKRYAGDLSAVTQLRRYVERIKKTKGLEKVKGILACPRISPNALKMLTDWGFEFARVSPPRYLEKFDKQQTKLI
jgi:RecB family endonuclease NucS